MGKKSHQLGWLKFAIGSYEYGTLGSGNFLRHGIEGKKAVTLGLMRYITGFGDNLGGYIRAVKESR